MSVVSPPPLPPLPPLPLTTTTPPSLSMPVLSLSPSPAQLLAPSPSPTLSPSSPSFSPSPPLSSLLAAQQVITNNWNLEDFACFRKCGDITVSPDAQTYGMNCIFCPGICLQFEVFIEHMREVHVERVRALYQTVSKCEQSTQTITIENEIEMCGDDDAADGGGINKNNATQSVNNATHTARAYDGFGEDEDFDIDVEHIDGGECAFSYSYNNSHSNSNSKNKNNNNKNKNAKNNKNNKNNNNNNNNKNINISNNANTGSDTDIQSAVATARHRQQEELSPRRQLRSTTRGNGTIADKPSKVCNWNEAPSAKYTKAKPILNDFKTLTTAITTPPTPAPTPSPWTTPIRQSCSEGSSTTIATTTNHAQELSNIIAMDEGDCGIGVDDTSLAVDMLDMLDTTDLLDMDAMGNGERDGRNRPEAPQEQVDLVYIMESAIPDDGAAVEEETVVDPFEMTAQGWRCATVTSAECRKKGLLTTTPTEAKEAQRKDLMPLPISTLKPQSGDKPLMNENEHSTAVIFYLLEAYKNHEKLWNPNHPQYKYNANRKMFEELARPLLRDMNYELSGSEIFAIIKSLRTRYRLELAKVRQRKGKYKTRFKYFEKMEFLRDVIENRRVTRQTKNRFDDSSASEKSLEDSTDTTRSANNRAILSKLLDAFRKREALWNPQHNDYLLCNKNELMRAISTELLVETGVSMTADECFTEIQKLRTRYRRELRIVHDHKGLYAPKLWCYEQMEFLQKIFEDQLRYRLKKRKGVIACKPKTQYLKANSINFKSTDDHLTFIEIYRSYSALWDVDHPDYRSTTYRNEELNQMLEEVNLMLGINSTLEELQKTLYELRKEFSAEKHKRLLEAATPIPASSPPPQSQRQPPPTPSPPTSIIQSKLMEFLDMNLGPFRCDVCAKVIKTSDQYKIHKSGHDGMQPFICTLCGKGFQIPGNLTIHIRRHKGDFPYSCAVCDKKFATSTEVAIHMRSHTGERPYICDVCGKSFKTWSFYDTHRRAHLNKSNFLCPICDKAFYERNRYTDHMNGHLNIRKHACDVCGKAYTTFANLKKHSEVHLSVKKYKCDICAQRFAHFASLRWHKRKTHDTVHGQCEQIEQ